MNMRHVVDTSAVWVDARQGTKQTPSHKAQQHWARDWRALAGLHEVAETEAEDLVAIVAAA